MEKKVRVLILGASGMAGHTIALYMKKVGYDVTAFTKTKFEYCNNIIGDAQNLDLLKDIILKEEYDVVINCIGILNSDAEKNKYSAVFLNSLLPHFLVDVTKNIKTKIIHMSTDCVFSGRNGNYVEDSFKDGESFYDRTKALGEINDSKNLTFRNSIIGPDIKENGIGLFNWFMKQNSDLQGYKTAIWTGVTTLTLAKAMVKAIECNLTGIYNLVNNDTINKYEMLILFNKHFKENRLNITPVDTVNLNKSLINTRKDFDFIVPSYEDMIIEMKEWINNNKNLYKHYFK